MTDVCDVAVVGAGVVGSAVTRELVAHGLSVTLVEAGPDVGGGTSKANTAIWHSGFDAVPDSLEARLVARGYQLLAERAPDAGWTLERTGALLVAWDDDQLSRLPGVEQKAVANGYHDIRAMTSGEVYGLEPHLGPGVQAGLLVPGEGLLDPWSITLQLATEAVVNGAQLMLRSPVTDVRAEGSTHVLGTGGGDVSCRWVVNTAGLASDEVDAMMGHGGFTVTPRRGQLLVFDKLARPLLSHVLLPVPTATTKGVLVSPTVYGNVLLGPTAEDLSDKSATATTAAGLTALLDHGRRIMPALMEHEVTATYSGLRAATEHSDYCYEVFQEQRYIRLGGIRSTGISSALALAEKVADDLRAAGEPMQAVNDFQVWRVPPITDSQVRPYEDADRIAEDPDYGEVVCHCERTTLGEIRDALGSPIPPVDVDGLRRRTRTLMGRCQGFFCGARVQDLLREGPRHG